MSVDNPKAYKCGICGDSHSEKTVKCIVQQMLIDYTAWVNGEPMAWNVKKREAIEAINDLRRADMEAVIGKDESIDMLLDRDWALIENSIRENGAKPYHYKSIRNAYRSQSRAIMEERLNG